MPELKTSPALRLAIFFITGIIAGSEIYLNIFALFVLLIFNLIVLIFLLTKQFPRVTLNILTALLILITGIIKSNHDFFVYPVNSVKFIEDTNRDSYDKLTGVVEDLPDFDSNKISFSVAAESIIRLKDTLSVSGKVLVTVRKDKYKSKSETAPVINPGDKVVLKGSLSAPDNEGNPGEFNYRGYLELQGVYKLFRVSGFQNVKIISENNAGFMYQHIIYPCRIFAVNVIDRNSAGDISAYLKGLVTGDRSDISHDTKSDFVNAGVMHLIAVSGLNVGYIILFITLLLSALRIPVLPGILITILILIFYCIFTGSSASIVRASVMGIVLLISYLLERKLNFFNSIGIALLIILVYDSRQIFDAGFILSFSAVISMVILYSAFEKIIIKKITGWNIRGKKLTMYFLILFFTSFAAQIGTLPVTASYFGKISVISLLANVVAVPAANLSLAIGFLQLITAVFSENLSVFPAEANNLLLLAQLRFIKWCASLTFSYVNIPAFSTAYIVMFYVFLFLLLFVKNAAEFIKRLLLIALMIFLLRIYNFDFNKKLRLAFLNVGQGDCALIRTPCDKVILIDCGMMSDNFNSGERTILPYLYRQGITKIDLLVITHLHADHIGGLNYLIGNIEIDKILESGQNSNSSYMRITDSLTAEWKIQREIVKEGDYIDEFENLRMYFLFPDDKFVSPDGKTKDDNLNNGSVVFKLKYKECEVLFTGDIEEEAEKHIISRFGNFLQTDILKAAHHGSITSSVIPFLLFAKPDAAVISCGKFNKFNHPSEIILDRFSKAGADVYRTDADGAVLFESDGYLTEHAAWK